ncbi:MAG: hypothetical protein ABIO60_12575 [Aquaticitalea sp.]
MTVIQQKKHHFIFNNGFFVSMRLTSLMEIDVASQIKDGLYVGIEWGIEDD